MPGPDASKLLIVNDAFGSELRRADVNGVAGASGALFDRLADGGYAVEVARSGPEALNKIQQSKFDLVLLDQTLGVRELDLLRLLRATYSPHELPVIVMTGAGEHDSASDALRHGANDCVMQPAELPELASRIETQLARAKALQQLERLDPLTRLGNRTSLLEQLHSWLAMEPASAALLLLDLDGFRRLNTSLGDGFGNEILIEAARRIQDAMRDAAWDPAGLARTGDDQFAIAGPHPGKGRLEKAAGAILERLNRPLVVQGFRLPLRASIGIAGSGSESATAEGLLRDAHLAMERARTHGGNRLEFFDRAWREQARNRTVLALELREAIEQNRLWVAYQPKIHLPERRVDGFEALLRWQRANGQVVEPVEFIPIAEDTGAIQEIGAWVLRKACRQLARWHREFPMNPPLTMNVNVSVKQLADPLLVEGVREILDETRIPPETLKLELTESVLMPEIASSEILENLRSLHVGLKLDDFGTGYSSLSYLRAHRFDSLKIARCFVSKVAADGEARAIVESIVTLAHALKMNVVAEGIETQAQLRVLEELGCDLGQGFLFHKPLDSASAESWLRRGLLLPRPTRSSRLRLQAALEPRPAA